MIRSSIRLLALAALLTGAPAFALHDAPDDAPNAGGEPAKHLAFGGVYVSPDSGRNVDRGAGASYGYGRGFGATRALEFALSGVTLETGLAGRTDFYQYALGLDLFQYFGNTASGHPYLVGGLGAAMNDVDPDSKDGFSGSANLGIGWRGAPLKGWGIRPRVDVRGTYDSFDSGQIDVRVNFALEVPAERERIVIQEKRVEVEKIVEVVKEVPAVVVPPPDRDGDGIPDAQDQCPDTVGGAKVEADGCVRKAQVVVLPNIEFALDRAELTEDGRETLGQVLRFMNDQPEITLDVWGHTDATGSETYNLRLSQKRAAAVEKFLVDNGIAATRLKSAGFGESRPLADNDTEEGRDRNRRVELNIRAPRNGG